MTQEQKYNNMLKDKVKQLDLNFDLLGNYYLIAPFKLFEVKDKKSNLVLTTNTSAMQADPDTHKIKMKEIEYPFQFEGIIIKKGVDTVKDLEEGDRVSFMRQNFATAEFFLDSNRFLAKEEIFIVKVGENMIERVYHNV